MKSGFKLALITLPIAAVGAAVLAFVVSNSQPPERIELAERALPVRVIAARIESIVPRITGFGVVTPARTFEAIAEVSGTVEYVNPALRDGQILPAGAVLLRLSPTDFNLAIAQAQANIRSAQARMAELDVSEQNQRTALAIEHEALAVKVSDLSRAETLLAAGSMAQSARDNARAGHLAQRQKVQGIEGTLALFPTQRAVQIEQIAVYEATLTTAERNLERSELTLPFAARVASHTVEVGQFLKAGQTAATLDGIASAEVVAQVSMGSLRDLMRSGQPKAIILPMDPIKMGDALHGMGLSAEVRLRLGEEIVTWHADVDRISAEIDQKTGTVGVVVQIQSAYGLIGEGTRPPLTKGMFVGVVLSTAPISGVVLPSSALRDGHIYLVTADNRLQIIEATPQLIQGGIALFTSAIPVDSRIVISPPNPVIEGLLLDPHPDTDLLPGLLNADAMQ